MENTTDEYDVIVIGSGTAGQTAAYNLKDKGVKVALVEKSDFPGGTCALSGCQPKKWFYEITETAAKSRHLIEKGITTPPAVSWPSILAQKNLFTHHIPDNTVEGLIKAGIDYFEGNAQFLNTDLLKVEDQRLTSKFFIVATGAKPMPLPIEGNEHIITSNDFLNLKELPKRILFIGGGFISFEFAHFAARLGPKNIKIIIIEAGKRPLASFDSEMVDLLVKASEDENIQILTDTKIKSVRKHRGKFSVISESGGKIETDLVVHGAGRTADIEDLNLEAAGVQFSRKGIRVDHHMRTSNQKIFAAGDCAETIQLARVADYEAKVAANNISANLFNRGKETISYNTVPVLLFTYPQYGMVGKTEDLLKEEGVEYRKSFGKNLRWPTYRRIGLNHAAYKILADPGGRVLGAHIISDNASGLINTLKTAMLNGTTVEMLYRQSIMTPYPTRESDIIYMLDPLKENKGE